MAQGSPGRARNRAPARRVLAEREARTARVLYMHEQGHSIREIASHVELGRETVRRIIAQDAATKDGGRADRRLAVLEALHAARQRISREQAAMSVLRKELVRLDEIDLELETDKLLGLI